MKYPIPTPHKITGLQLYQPEIVMLDNDIRLQIINLGIQDVSRIDIVIEGGSCDGKNIFISSLLAKTLQEGTATMTSAEIAEKLDTSASECKSINDVINRMDAIADRWADMDITPVDQP